MFDYFRSLDWPLAMLIIFLFSLFLSWVLLLFSRKIRDKEVTHHHQVLTILLGFVTLVFGIQVSFVIVLQQQWINEGTKVKEREVTYLAGMLRDAKRLTPEHRKAVENSIYNYLNYVVHEEWPIIEHGQGHFLMGEAYLEDLWDTYKNLPIEGERERIWYDDSLEELKLFSFARNERLALSNSSIHPMLWAWILLLGIGTIFLVSLMPIQRFTLNLFLMAVYTSIIVMVLYLTFTLDHPFQGQIRVDPYEFNELLNSLNANRSA